MASSKATDILTRRGLIPCARRWRGSTRRWPSSQLQPRRPRRRPEAVSRRDVGHRLPLFTVPVHVITSSMLQVRRAMNAREVMTSPVISVTANTPVRDIAQLLLKNHISAVPILDYSGAPIGMVSEGDLIGRRNAQREWWLALLAECELLSSDFLSELRRPERVAIEIMSKPVVTVGEDTDAAEIARLLTTYRIKRVPVVRDGRVVGIVSRENLLRWMANEAHPRRQA